MSYFVWDVDPAIFHLGSLQLRYYGIFFVGSFFMALYVVKKIFIREKKPPQLLDNLVIYALIGTVIGARLMHCFAYEPSFYLAHPMEIVKVWKGGLASHGGLLGVLVAFYIFSKRYKLDFMWLISRMAIVGPIVAASVRIGNFFNSEILGVKSSVPWAVIFSRVDLIPRHPVQLYEATAYILLFAILWFIYSRLKPKDATLIIPGLFLSLMFAARFILEYFKTKQEAYNLPIDLTTGQLLSIPFVIFGLIWVYLGYMKIKRR